MAVDRAARSREWAPEFLKYGLIAASVWLGWEIVKTPLVQRGPPAIALRLSSSPEALRRAAETELLAGRVDNADVLAGTSLSQAPFNARALRIRGLVAAERGEEARADEILTLAGNWSLRDDPSHAWLVERRLRRGDYGSAFAHADTLARRREDLHPSLFGLFATAAREDTRSVPALGRQLGANPPWRPAFVNYLFTIEGGDQVLANLAIALEGAPTPIQDHELGRLYQTWAGTGRFEAIRYMRARLGRPPLDQRILNHGFETESADQMPALGWRFHTNPGHYAEIVADDLREGSQALRVQHDGYNAGVFTDQILMLTPGRYRFSADSRIELADVDPTLIWTISCLENGVRLAAWRPAGGPGAGSAWRKGGVDFAVPAQGCSGQWLRLEADPGDRRTEVVVWFDNLAATPLAGSSEGAAR